MKKGDLVTWLYQDTKRPSHFIGIIIDFEKMYGMSGAWVLWSNAGYEGKRWSPIKQLAVLS